LTTLAQRQGEHLHVIEAADRTNEAQLEYVLQKIDPRPGLRIALLGLSFKPGTDDLRDAPALRLAERLTKMGVIVTGYDPAAKTLLDQKNTIEEAVKGAEVAVIMTEWDDIKHVTPKQLKANMKTARLIDGRNCWAFVDEPGDVQYEGIGRPSKTFSNNPTS